MLEYWDVENREPLWMAMRFSDGSYVTYSPAGEILYGDTAELEDKLVYVVQREPNGPQELWTFKEFQEHLKNAEMELIATQPEPVTKKDAAGKQPSSG